MLDLSTLGQKKPAAAPSTHPSSAPSSVYVRDTDSARFETDVIAASMTKPVIVDFWAAWCGPCKQLLPMLEKAVEAAQGAVTMVKVDIDKCPDLAQVFRVQSVPTVYAFFKGQPVDGFMGGQPESQIKAFVARLAKLGGAVPDAAPALDIPKRLAEADAYLAAGKTPEAIASYSDVLDVDPAHTDALAGLGWCFVAMQDREAVQGIIDGLEDAQKNTPRLKGLAFIAAEQGAGAMTVEAAAEEIAANPKNLEARFDLARRQVAAFDIAGAIDSLIDLTRIDRNWQEQKARNYLISLFDALGSAHPLTLAGRRRLSSILFS